MANIGVIAKQEIENYKNNPVVRNFVEDNAYKKVLDDINRIDPGNCCSEKGIRLIVQANHDKDIKKRWDKYVHAGYVGVLLAKVKDMCVN